MRSAPGCRRLLGSAALAVGLFASAAFAQPVPPTAPPPTASLPADPAPASRPQDPPVQSPGVQPQTSVTVVAPAPGYRSRIDGRSYSLATDLQKDAGSLADVLRNLPAVQVDLDGNISLRGDTNVTILVDGKPSALFSGPGRAQALQSISASQYDRVEVMTSPPAGVTSEGSGGVINLISKSPPKGVAAPTSSGALKADIGSGNRFDLGASGAYTAHGVSLSGGADFRRSGFLRTIDSHFGLPDPVTGALDPAEAKQAQKEREDGLSLYGTAGYDLGPHDHLDAGLNGFAGRLVQGQDVAYRTASETGPLALAYVAPGFTHGRYTSLSESLGLTHALPGEGQTLSIKLSASQSRLSQEDVAAYTYQLPAQPSLYQDLPQRAAFPQLDLKVDYVTSLPNKAKLTTGYEGRFDWQDESNLGYAGGTAALAVAQPALAQTFRFDQQVHALYVTYEQGLGRLTVQPGLRLENTTLDTDLASAAERGRQAYVEANPSLHLDYKLDDTSELKASYGRRLQRPDENQLDPFRIEATPTAYSAGNPQLRPAVTQSYEFGYEFRRKTTDLQATLFYRDKTDLLTVVNQDIGGDVLLSTWSNLGHQHDVGLELVADHPLFKTLTINASTDLLQATADAQNLGLAGARSGFIVSAHVTLNWQAARDDQVQLGGSDSGRQLTAQGYRGGAIFSSLAWRHRFDARLAALLSVDNPFGLSRRTLVTDTPTLVDVEKRKFNPVAVFLGLTYAFGAASRRGDGFDFGREGQGGP